MAYQFFHIETYSEAPTLVHGTKDQFNSAEQVEEEARRSAAYSEHVAEPRPYVQIDGTLKIDDFIASRRKRVAALHETVTAKNGTTYTRSLRRDAATLYTEVHSHPIKSEDYLSDSDKYLPEINRWKRLVMRDFRNRMPEGVQFTAVLHADEAHLHIHILAFNAGDPKLDANKLHAGKRAAADDRKGKKSDAIASQAKPDLNPRPNKPKNPRPTTNRVTQKKNEARHALAVAEWEAKCAPIDAENTARMAVWKIANDAHLKAERIKRGTPSATKAYNAALRQLQDDYHEAVGKPCGLLRHGPRQQRRSTKQYRQDQDDAQRLAQAHEQMESREEALTRRETSLAVREEDLEAATAELKRVMGARDEFSLSTKRILAERAAHFCSNPDCRKLTTGPHSDPQKSLKTGHAAHICAAASNGPRYDASQTPPQRKHATNGLWLCRECGDIVDKDTSPHTAAALLSERGSGQRLYGRGGSA